MFVALSHFMLVPDTKAKELEYQFAILCYTVTSVEYIMHLQSRDV